VQRLEALGIGADAVLGSLPPLSADAQQAAHCWHWCGGWEPQRWPVYAALHDVDDWDALAELMLAIRTEHDKP
jgi:hypothetical protein